MPRGRPPKPKESKARGDTGKRPRPGRPRCAAPREYSPRMRRGGRRERAGPGAAGRAGSGPGAWGGRPSASGASQPLPPPPPPDCRAEGRGRNDTGAARPAPPPGWAYFSGPRGRAAGPGARRAPPPSPPPSSSRAPARPARLPRAVGGLSEEKAPAPGRRAAPAAGGPVRGPPLTRGAAAAGPAPGGAAFRARAARGPGLEEREDGVLEARPSRGSRCARRSLRLRARRAHP